MTDETRDPFQPHDETWYDQPLDYENVIYEADRENHLAKITLNRPEAMNAMNRALLGELWHAIKTAERDNEINAILVKGAGRCFSAGYDLGPGATRNLADMGSQFPGVSQWPRYVTQMWWQLWELSKVVVAQVHGYALAGGSEFAAMCDLVVATPDCQFGYPVVRAMGVDMFWFPWLLPMRKAHEMVFTGDSLSGEEAYRLGMINYCVPAEHIDEFAETFAKRVALMPWQLATLYKRNLKKAYEVQGMRTAIEFGAQHVLHMAGETDFARKMNDLFVKVPLREYLTVRDGRYKDYRAAEQAILDRSQREGDAWQKVAEQSRPKDED